MTKAGERIHKIIPCIKETIPQKNHSKVVALVIYITQIKGAYKNYLNRFDKIKKLNLVFGSLVLKLCLHDCLGKGLHLSIFLWGEVCIAPWIFGQTYPKNLLRFHTLLCTFIKQCIVHPTKFKTMQTFPNKIV